MFLRYADKNLVPHVKFTGLYEFVLTTGKKTSKNSPWCFVAPKLMKAYEGAENIADKYNDARAVGRKSKFLAPYGHCGAHCAKLMT